MQQLTGLDLMFLGLDTETTNGILGGLVLFETPQPGTPLPDEAFMRHRITERLPLIPPMRRRLAGVPLGLGLPFLVEPDRIDVSDHLRTIRLPAPGTQEQLAEEVSRLMSTTTLPMDRPLWDLHVIEGLQDGGVAHLLRIHHVVVDGSSMPTVWDLLSDQPTETPDPASLGSSWPEPAGGWLEMLARELVGVVRQPVDAALIQARMAGWVAKRSVAERGLTLPAMMARMLPGPLGTPVAALVNRGMQAVGGSPVRPYLPAMTAPETDFNGRLTARRRYVFDQLPLADLKLIGKTFGVTLNDVVVAISAGAVRQHLQRQGRPASRPLVVCVPVSLRQGDEQPRWANWVHMIFASLPVHMADPIDRLRFVNTELKEVKGSFDAMPIHLMRPMSRFMPPQAMSIPAKIMVKLPDRLSRVPWNVVVSNVKGPTRPARVNGLLVEGYWPASFLSIGGGLNITLQSYLDRVCFGFMVCADQVDDLDPLVASMRAGLAELLAAAQAARSAQEAHPRPNGSTRPTPVRTIADPRPTRSRVSAQ